ncbi:uncharacterized protein LOC135683358 isoform X2 [Rhopilema esculentum]|eukprot:gene15860-7184_t
MSKHIFLSYQWDIQDLVKKVYKGLKDRGLPVWMDTEGGMSGNINDSMAFGVENAAVVCPFMTSKYQDSKNCKKELNYADSQNVDIVPIMAQKDWKATAWLGIITAGMLWMDFRPDADLAKSISSLTKEIMHTTQGQLEKTEPTIAAVAKELETRPGRAFKHLITGKFLAESGQVKFHPASGNRSTLVLRDEPEETSYWVEERNKEIFYYKNYATNGYLGYDPNGDYIYTKAQHYGAEEWKLIADESMSTGERAVVIFANYGKKYLAIRNGKLTGVANKDKDCVWILD